MAYTKIHAIKRTVQKAIKYIIDPQKTEGKLLVTGYNCSPETADLEFGMTSCMAKTITGDYSQKGENLAYHLIQSFAKWDKITPEEAHQVGKKLADKLLLGEHEYVIATHVDKEQIHNHIIFNAVSENYKHFRSVPYKTAKKIRTISDELCRENGLSVIQKESGLKGKSYKEYTETKDGTSWKAKIKVTIDTFIDQAKNFDDFVRVMKANQVLVKDGKHIAFRLIGQDRFVRGKSIGSQYTKEAIISRIGNDNLQKQQPKNIVSKNKYAAMKESILQVHKLANILVLVSTENINTYNEFAPKIQSLEKYSNEISEKINIAKLKNNKYKEIAKLVVTYNKFLPFYNEYNRKSIFTKKYYEDKYESQLRAFRFAKEQLESRNIDLTLTVNEEKLITFIKGTDAELKELKEEKQQLNQKLSKIKEAEAIIKKVLMGEQEFEKLIENEKYYPER